MGEPGAGWTGQVGAGQVGTGQVCTSRFGTCKVRTGQVKTSQAGQVCTSHNGQVLLGTRVWPYSVLLVLPICQAQLQLQVHLCQKLRQSFFYSYTLIVTELFNQLLETPNIHTPTHP